MVNMIGLLDNGLNMRMTDPYLSIIQTTKRLVSEWMKHGDIIVAYDYDNTVYDFHEKGHTFTMVKELLREVGDMGGKFIVYSCSPKSRHEEIKTYLTSENIPFDYINEPAVRLGDFDDGSGKLFYSIFLDDRAGLTSAYMALMAAMRVMKQKPEDVAIAHDMVDAMF